MFSMAVQGGKAFAAEQKLRELKKRLFRLKALGKKFKKSKPVCNNKKYVDNMNSLPTSKYRHVPNNIKGKTLNSEADRERFNFSRLGKISREKFRHGKI